MEHRTGVDLTVISPPHSNGAAALLLGDVGGQDAVAEHSVVEVQVALLLLVSQHSNCCRRKNTRSVSTQVLKMKIQGLV